MTNENKKPETTYDTIPTCPYCGFVHKENDGYSDGDVFECPECGKKGDVEIYSQYVIHPREE